MVVGVCLYVSRTIQCSRDKNDRSFLENVFTLGNAEELHPPTNNHDRTCRPPPPLRVHALQVRVEISAPNGQVTLTRVAGLDFESGNGISNHFLAFTGHSGDVNAAIRNAVYRGDPDWNTLGNVPNAVFIRASNSHAGLGGLEPIAVQTEQKFW